MRATVAVLAGGLGSRIGGDKAVVALGGRALIEYPLAAASDAGLDAVVVAKRATRLPRLEVPVLLEPDEPSHPLLGIITALERRPTVIALPCDMPFVRPEQLEALGAIDAELATLWHREPFPSLYRAALLPQLRRALEAGQSMRATQAHACRAPSLLSATEPRKLLSVNTREDLAAAERLLKAR
jgi:molybdenum cofactor guanylyltransferase